MNSITSSSTGAASAARSAHKTSAVSTAARLIFRSQAEVATARILGYGLTNPSLDENVWSGREKEEEEIRQRQEEERKRREEEVCHLASLLCPPPSRAPRTVFAPRCLLPGSQAWRRRAGRYRAGGCGGTWSRRGGCGRLLCSVSLPSGRAAGRSIC